MQLMQHVCSDVVTHGHRSQQTLVLGSHKAFWIRFVYQDLIAKAPCNTENSSTPWCGMGLV